MSFPFETEEAVILEENNLSQYEYGINFKMGRLTGDKVEGIEALKIWIYLALHTARYRFVIYSWDYGNELDELIGKSYSKEYLEMECKDMVEQCLLVNEKIESIDNFNMALNEDKLTISFTANTIYGEVDINV
ncbi:DUF2634 domain-containing protein [Anaeromicropila herbilytica]|uniref:DUF2634 domain-containing protein n=1 Tax=Anaeromicropila herbilytica TaxID=2785025 RepID=A0A7R7IFE8_9FIRM|nr:DUF2634 domain-containing protein [Anaeromicropila herbilytica]BCN32063.1 hypothetical protein bsdtb5_33580 [Anaeromicropila herbilytica]